MATYPALVQLLRTLGRADALAVLRVDSEPDPASLSIDQRTALIRFLDARCARVADELVAEAAASDDVTGAADGLAFVRDRLAAFDDLITVSQAAHLLGLAEQRVAGWH